MDKEDKIKELAEENAKLKDELQKTIRNMIHLPSTSIIHLKSVVNVIII